MMIIESTTFDYHEKRDDNSNVFGMKSCTKLLIYIMYLLHDIYQCNEFYAQSFTLISEKDISL